MSAHIQWIDRLHRGEVLSAGEFAELIDRRTPELSEYLFSLARRVSRARFGNQSCPRGRIESRSFCKNNCRYCGIRRGNPNAQRYRLSEEEILSCCDMGERLGYKTFVLQGGEDAFFTDGRLIPLIQEIKRRHPDCALTLSLGERSRESYQALFDAGADRYLLRHEAADPQLYRALHPPEMEWENRVRCLYDLKEIGYQVGAGFMVGAPGQTSRHLARDLCFLAELRPQMVGIGPFVPHHDTEYRDCPAGSVELTLFLLGLIRLMLPDVLLPATTALGTVCPDGRERGVLAGANVVMPNLSPAEVRKKYSLYDNKLSTGAEDAGHWSELQARMQAIGYELTSQRGDAPGYGR